MTERGVIASEQPYCVIASEHSLFVIASERSERSNPLKTPNTNRNEQRGDCFGLRPRNDGLLCEIASRQHSC